MAEDSVNLQILLMARQLVINGHTDLRADLHNQWLVDSAALWAQRRQQLAYPPIPPYPTEAEIVARARALLEFVHSDSTINPDTVADTLSTVAAQATVPESTSQTSAELPGLELELVPVDNPLPASDYSETFSAHPEPKPPAEPAAGTSFLQHLERLRTGWNKS